MSTSFRSSLALALAALVCPACELVLGDIPENPSSAATDGGAAGTAPGAGGFAGAEGIDASTAGAGGSNGEGGSIGPGGSNSAGSSSGGSAGAGAAGGKAGSGGSVGTAGAGGAGAGGTAGKGGNGGTAGSMGAGASGGTSGAGGAGGSAGSSGGAAGSTPIDASSDADPCDMDGDGFRSRSCPGGDDCDDTAKLVYPGQPNFFEDPTHVGGTNFDFDCNGLPQPQFGSVSCSSLLGLGCDQSGSAFFGTTAPACGQTGTFGHCKVSGLSCVEQPEQDVKKMPCK